MFDFIYIYVDSCIVSFYRSEVMIFFFSLFKVPQNLRPVSNFMGFLFIYFGFCFCLSDPESNSVFMFSVVLM